MMRRKKKAQDVQDEMPVMASQPLEDLTSFERPMKSSHLRVVGKEFDIRAAHHAWKEKNGIESDDTW